MSVNYYNENAESFHKRTIGLDMGPMYKNFLSYMPLSGKILDAGCGTGRDGKYFLKQGYQVTAFDASIEMVKISSQLLEQPTFHLRFEDMTFENEFDGIWANASLLHVPYDHTRNVFEKLYKALKSNGILYFSYKYGESNIAVNGRDFYNMTEETIKSYIQNFFTILSCEVSRAAKNSTSPNQMWLKVVCKKI